jgi:pyruvate,water dikinase
LSEDEYLTVLGGIKDISHLRPFYAMWDISRKIRKNKKEQKYWQTSAPKQILKDLQHRPDEIARAIEKMIEDYGYHSDKELDVTFECYFENPLPYIENIKNMVALEDKYGPEQDQKRNHRKYLEIMDRIHKEIGDRKFKKVEAKIKHMRKMLWWREEFRDTSTRFYYLVHIYTVELGKELARQKVLKNADDVWMLKIGDLWKYYNQEHSPADLRAIVDRRRHYYNCFRNYMSDNEIYSGNTEAGAAVVESDIHGLGACSGKITATARVIYDFSEIDRLQEGDILVTRFTDTGWTPKFAIISGIVTEYGGILCHAAIVSREYGIPAVVNCHDALKKIKDGQKITIDGSTGNVTIEDK